MLFFLFGPDTYRSRQKLKEIKEKYLKEVDLSGSSLVVIDGEKVKFSGLGEHISPTSLFARKRMIIVENIFSNKDNTIFDLLLKYLNEQVKNENIVIFCDSVSEDEKLTKDKKALFKYLANQKFSQNFKLLSNTNISAWVKTEVEARGGKINRQAANELTALLGSDLWSISNEINKLLSYKAGKEKKILEGGPPISIELEDVKENVSGSIDENIFALTDAFGNKNKALALKLLEEQIEAGATAPYLLSMIIRQFRILLMIKEALDQGNTSRKIAGITKLHPFVIQKGINQTRNYTPDLLKTILNKLVVIEEKIKTGKGEFKTELNLLFIKL